LENILPCPFLSLLTIELRRSHLFCAVTLPDSESSESPRRVTNGMWFRDDDHNDLRMRHSNRIAATGLPLSRVQLLQQIEIKESSLKAALAHNEVVEKKEMCCSEFCSCLYLRILYIFFLACEQGAQFCRGRNLVEIQVPFASTHQPSRQKNVHTCPELCLRVMLPKNLFSSSAFLGISDVC
jgi:hypothetical protein